MIKYMEADLFCLHCNKNTNHVIYYNGDEKIIRIKCQDCKTEIELKDDFISKNKNIGLLEKSFKMTEELISELNKFLFSIPIKILKSPSDFINKKNWKCIDCGYDSRFLLYFSNITWKNIFF